MTKPEVEFVLDAIKEYAAAYASSYGMVPYGAGLDGIPLERVDRDNSDLLDDQPVHEVAPKLEEMNYVGAASVDRSTSPVGTEYDHSVETVVGVRIVGLHAEEWGAIDPQKGTADEATRDYPTISWDVLVESVRRAVLAKRRFPDTGRSNVGYKDLLLTNETDSSSDYGDAYRYDFDVVFAGFETLP